MSDGLFTAEDLAAWPPELRAAWAEGVLPGPHDLLLELERLAMEIRRQNQELRRLAQAQAAAPAQAQAAPAAVAPEALLAEFAALRGHVAEAESARLGVLLAVADSVILHHKALARAAAELEEAVPRWTGFLRPARPAWRARLSAVLASQAEGARMAREKALAALAGLGVEPVPAAKGDAFDPALHLAVETVPGLVAGRIYETVREGWRRGDRLLRAAEVSVTRAPKKGIP